MLITETTTGGALVLRPAGRLDSDSAKGLEDVLGARMQAEPVVVVDLAGVPYVSSAGLRVLLKAAKIARSTGHRLVLAGLSPQVHDVFEVSGFTSIFTIRADLASALQAA